MTTLQRKIGSGYGERSTAEDVLRGIDLTGKLAIVTGGYSGIGLETTRALARAGARVVVPARRTSAAREAVAVFGDPLADRVEVDQLDLGDLDSVRDFAERFLASGRRVDLLIANAGIALCPETRVGPGWEAQFATNHLGHFALVNRLWPAVARDGAARVVSVSSGAHGITGIRWDDVHFTRGYDKWQAYGQAKTANVLFAVHLDRLGRDAGVRAFAVHPGMIMTPLQRHLTRAELVEIGWIDEHGRAVEPALKTPEQGAATQVWAATSPRLAGLGGVYCQDCDVAELAAGAGKPGVARHAVDPDEAARLWTLSAELTGVDAFAPARARGV
ncbi:SDR family NAD(P)-dependent oxidoreductase [Sorangium sp. So ce233]|uniref:SDR family NAD(P)-dependent oxidoreductase n=1 Tax=Sorangium sp. So ce233 TaxID=3133290 RepID=UPI003F5D5A51